MSRRRRILLNRMGPHTLNLNELKAIVRVIPDARKIKTMTWLICLGHLDPVGAELIAGTLRASILNPETDKAFREFQLKQYVGRIVKLMVGESEHSVKVHGCLTHMIQESYPDVLLLCAAYFGAQLVVYQVGDYHDLDGLAETWRRSFMSSVVPYFRPLDPEQEGSHITRASRLIETALSLRLARQGDPEDVGFYDRPSAN